MNDLMVNGKKKRMLADVPNNSDLGYKFLEVLDSDPMTKDKFQNKI